MYSRINCNTLGLLQDIIDNYTICQVLTPDAQTWQAGDGRVYIFTVVFTFTFTTHFGPFSTLLHVINFIGIKLSDNKHNHAHFFKRVFDKFSISDYA